MIIDQAPIEDTTFNLGNSIYFSLETFDLNVFFV